MIQFLSNNFKLKSLAKAMLITGSISLVGCGGTSSSNKDSNNAPEVSDMSITLQSGETVTRTLDAKDTDGDQLTYSITSQPTHGEASISNGQVTYKGYNEIAEDSMEVSVSDGKETKSISIAINLQSEPALTYQFYKVTNPETGNDQVVRYDPNDSNDETNQKVVKTNVVLGDDVFVMSGVKEDDKMVFQKREYGIFLDPNASSETRTRMSRGSQVEYTFYFDNVLKKFDAANPDTETVIYNSTMLPQALKDDGIKVIGNEQRLFLNQQDTANSYVQLKAYDELADAYKSEDPDEKLHVPLTVRLSDSKMTQGRTLAFITEASGDTSNVLVNYIAPHTSASYPDGDANTKRLQICDADLVTCTDVTDGTGNYFTIGQNTGHVYLAKKGSTDIYAFDKAAHTVDKVTGISYPAEYDNHHHQLGANGHGGGGVLSNFTTIGNLNNTLSDGDTSYIAVNYDLDTDTKISDKIVTYKHAMILKIQGTAGQKVFDNGDGVDHMNSSGDNGEEFKEHISLAAVKDGKVFMETSRVETDDTKCAIDTATYNYCVVHSHAVVDTNGVTEAKTSFDVDLSESTPNYMNYLAAKRVPALAVGDDVYFSIWDRNSSSSAFSGGLIYNVYKMSFDSLTAGATLPATPTTHGRMFFERTAYRTSGVYDGSVVTWNSQNSEVRNITSDILIGKDSDIETEADTIVNVYPKDSNDNRIGVDGLIGLRMATGHGGATFITSGKTDSADSLKNINHIGGAKWIID